MADHENSVPVNISFSETTFLHSRFECHSWQVCVFKRKHPARTGGISFAGSCFSCQEPATVTGSGVDLRTGIAISIRPKRKGCFALSGNWSYIYGTRNESGRAVSGCLYIGTATSEISWEVISADGSWRQSWKPMLKLIESITEWQLMKSGPCQHHGLTTVKWRYLTFCQQRFLRSSGVFQNSYLWDMACITDGMSTLGPVVVAQQVVDPGHLHPPPIAYTICMQPATATTFLMKITWFLAGIFMYGME